MKNGTLVPILGALISVWGGFRSGLGCLPERDRRLALGKQCGWPRAILAITRRLFDACPEPVEGAAMIFKPPPQFGTGWGLARGSLGP